MNTTANHSTPWCSSLQNTNPTKATPLLFSDCHRALTARCAAVRGIGGRAASRRLVDTALTSAQEASAGAGFRARIELPVLTAGGYGSELRRLLSQRRVRTNSFARAQFCGSPFVRFMVRGRGESWVNG